MGRARPLSHADPIRLAAALALGLALATPAAPSPQLIPKMNVSAPPNWTGPILPRAVAGADSAGLLAASDTLWSNRGTYLNWCTSKNPAICGSWTDELSLDGEVIEGLSRSDCDWAIKYFPALDQGPTFIRGGRHQLDVQADVYWTVSTDYDFPPGHAAVQFVWSPMAASQAGVWTSVSPPWTGSFPHPNCEGYRADRANPWAWAFAAVARVPGADVDLALDVDPWQGSGAGFSDERARSAEPAGRVDFVVGSGAGTPSSLYPAVIRGAAGGSGGYLLTWVDAEDHRDSTATMSWPSDKLDWLHAVRVYEVWLAAGSTLHADLTRTGGLDDIEFSVFPPDGGGIWSRAQAVQVSTPVPGQPAAWLRYTASATGWHPVMVCRNSLQDPTGDVTYSLRFGPGVTNGLDAPAPPLFLAPAAPNPAVSRTRFTFGLPREAPVTLTVHDAQGRRVRTLARGVLPAGRHEIDWDLRGDSGVRVAPGLYWARFEAGGRTFTRRLAILD